jgi:hypothetical protein
VKVLGIPADFATVPDFTHRDEKEAVPVAVPIEACMDVDNKGGNDWMGLQGYITYLSLLAAKPIFTNVILTNKGTLLDV